jgi:hypothetical protein
MDASLEKTPHIAGAGAAGAGGEVSSSPVKELRKLDFRKVSLPFQAIRKSQKNSAFFPSSSSSSSFSVNALSRSETGVTGRVYSTSRWAEDLPDIDEKTGEYLYGRRLLLRLEEEIEDTSRAAECLEILSQETVEQQRFAVLHPTYIQIQRTGAREQMTMVRRLVLLCAFARERRAKAGAMGVWKLLLVQAEGLRRQLAFRKKASALWMGRRFTEYIKCILRLRIRRWVHNTMLTIFYSRVRAVIPIQSLYRMWRDRQLFLRLHNQAPYDGPLSDIFLAPSRSKVRFWIPEQIRSERRMFWLACVIVQARYRGLVCRRFYLSMRGQLVSLQAFLRMIPYRERYKVLRKTTIICQVGYSQGLLLFYTHTHTHTLQSVVLSFLCLF